MKLKIAIPSLSLLVLFVFPILSLLSVVAFAEDKNECSGESCNDKDPDEYQCKNKAKTLATKIGKKEGPPGSTMRPKVELMYSENCNSKWVKATAPENSSIVLKDKQGLSYAFKRIDKPGAYESSMRNGETPLQACISLYNRDQVCTNIK
jgi:hypothetical protein